MPRRTATIVALPRRSDLSTSADTFMHELESANRADKTRKTYRESIDQLERFLRDTGRPLTVADIGKRDMEAFFIHERHRGMSETTIAIRWRSLRPFFNFLVREGDLAVSPMAGMPQPHVEDKPPPTIDEDDLNRLFRACAGSRFEDRRDLAVIALFADSGIRLGEMTGIRVTDLDLDRKEVRVSGKTGQRAAKYGNQTRRDIERYLKLRPQRRDADTPWLWLGLKGRLDYYGIAQMVERRATKAGIKAHPHLFRHTFAHNYLSQAPDGTEPGNELDLAQLGGWKDLQTVARYGRSAAGARARRNYDRHSIVDRLRRG